MDKALDFLERYVQWIALGIGVLFLGWMAYAYLVTPPLTVQIGNQTLEPGEVDAAIAKTTAKDLSTAIANGKPPPFPRKDPWPEVAAGIDQPPRVTLPGAIAIVE